MYTISDVHVLGAFHQAFSLAAKIGEFVVIQTTAAHMHIKSINNSSSVMYQADFPKDMFGGPGSAPKTVQIRAKAADVVLARAGNADLQMLTIRFGKTSAGAELLEVKVESTHLVTKAYQIPCLQVSMDFEPLQEYENPYEFRASIAFFKGVTDQFLPSAEELDLQIGEHQTTFWAFKDSTRIDKEARSLTSIHTTIHVSTQSFEALRIQTPWKAGMRLKEFRLMLSFLDHIDKESSITGNTGGPGSPLVFFLQHPVVAAQYKFVFKTKAKRPVNDANRRMVEFGEYSSRLSTAASVRASRLSTRTTSIDSISARSMRSVRPTSAPSMISSVVRATAPSRHMSAASAASDATVQMPKRRRVVVTSEGSMVPTATAASAVPTEDMLLEPDDVTFELDSPQPQMLPEEVLADVTHAYANEIGMTQDVAPARGLFD